LGFSAAVTVEEAATSVEAAEDSEGARLLVVSILPEAASIQVSPVVSILPALIQVSRPAVSGPGDSLNRLQ
jgi:hypothetical protein